MKRVLPSILVLGAGPAARTAAAILRVPLVGRNKEDIGWDWHAGNHPYLLKLALIAPAAGADAIVRQHGDARRCPAAVSIGVVIVAGRHTRETLLARDVFGRKTPSDARFADWQDVTKVVDCTRPLGDLLSALASVKGLPVATWKRQAEEATCIPALFKAVSAKDIPKVTALLPRARAIYWDALCPHSTANAIASWLERAANGAEPDWKAGLALFSPLAGGYSL